MRSSDAEMRSDATMIRRSVATGCCRADTWKQSASTLDASASMASSPAMTLSARARSESSSAWVARFIADWTSRVISTRSSLTASSISWYASRMVFVPR
jgi:hypothetical protein